LHHHLRLGEHAAMRVTESVVDVSVSFGVVRAAVVRPVTTTPVPLLLCFADIFGNSEAHLRVMRRLASHGFVVVSPEPWAHHLPPGSVLDFDADRERALACQDIASADAADEARRALIAHFSADGGCSGAVCAIGFCYGGHLSFRAATDAKSDVVAAACFYGTGLHRDRLGNTPTPTLSQALDIKGELLLVWGRQDPHIPAEGRALIHRTLDDAGVRFETRLYDADHAFGRDVGPRYDAAAFDDAVMATLALFRRMTGG
jgi:carboxymethylenebutenolidase